MLFNLQNESDRLKAQTALKGFLQRGDTIELKQFKNINIELDGNDLRRKLIPNNPL